MKTVAIIVNHNDGENLIKLVSSIREYKNLDAVIVVDNASESPIPEAVTTDSKVIIINAPKNGGYGYGNNIGLKKAKELGANYAIIANPDTEWSEECVSAMIDELEKGAAVCAPMCITPNSKYAAPISAWPIRSWHLELFERGPICRRLFKKKLNYGDAFFSVTRENISAGSCANPYRNDGIEHSKSDGGSTNTVEVSTVFDSSPAVEVGSVFGSCPVEVGAVLGSCLAVDVNKILEVGGYDDNVFLYCEENILGYKLKEHGYKTMLLKDKTYLHNHTPALPSKQSIRNLRDSELYYFEHYLKVGKFKLWLSKVFFGIISLEINLTSSKKA